MLIFLATDVDVQCMVCVGRSGRAITFVEPKQEKSLRRSATPGSAVTKAADIDGERVRGRRICAEPAKS